MAGLDSVVVDEINWSDICDQISIDSRTDFILSPHYDAIFQHSNVELVSTVRNDLRSGRYFPRLPITFSVPKEGWLTRPGSILEPADRLVYHGITGHILQAMEAQLDRTRTFSHVPTDANGHLFEATNESWDRFQGHIADICENNNYVLRTDVSNFFETINQHQLINSLREAGANNSATSLLEELLLAFRQRYSAGIIQGIYPSDVLGNYYLIDLDGYCASNRLPSARYVDDVYVGFDSEAEARVSLLAIIERLRRHGLHLNPSKTSIEPGAQIIHEEQEIDRQFANIRELIQDHRDHFILQGYGFQGDWINGEETNDEINIDLMAVRSLLEDDEFFDNPQTDKIHRFCLPLLRAANDESAVEQSISGIQNTPHLTRLYSSYLTQFTRDNDDIVRRVEDLIEENPFFSDYQRMYALASILNCEEVQQQTVENARRWMESNQVGPETRAICAIFVAKFGTPHQKRSVIDWHDSDTSEYVRGSILYATRYMTRATRATARNAWGRLNPNNTLIASTL